MNIKASAINSFANWLVGGVAFGAAKDIVQTLNNTDLSNDEKRIQARDRLYKLGYALAGWAANLAVELAVAWLKTKAGEKI